MQQPEIDLNGLIIRRSDPDDADSIVRLVEIGKDDVFNRVYSYPQMLKLIESSYMALTLLDNEGNVVGFAAFEDSPQGIRGMQDDKHYNYWEKFMKEAFKVEEFTARNTLWLSYFICGGSIDYDSQQAAFKRVLQTIYTSLSDILGILFLARGDADAEDISYCFEPLSQYFEEIPIKNEAAFRDIRGIPGNSRIFFSSRVLILPFIEIRRAAQEDHDDLADVFNNQSETVTEAYGEYFLAELIASQNDHNKALVAQVKDKAIGLMGLTDEVDTSLLYQCFDLDHFDNLLKPDFMDAIKKRREYVEWEQQVAAEKQRIRFLRQLKQETMKCNVIAQRIALQEHLIALDETIQADIEEYTSDPDGKLRTLNTEAAKEMFDKWLEEFKIEKPSEFFENHKSNDTELMCSIQSKQEFLFQTLEYFGLPKGYIHGKGHHPTWMQKRMEERSKKRKGKQKETAAARALRLKVEKRKKEQGKGDKGDYEPEHFDIELFRQALKRFSICQGEMRSKLRMLLLSDINKTMNVFSDDHEEQSFRKILDVNEFAELLQKNGFEIGNQMFVNLGAMLLCFGEIEHEVSYGKRLPPQTEDYKRAVFQHNAKKEERERIIAEKKAEDPEAPIIEDELPVVPPIPERKPEMTKLYLMSITDIKFALQKMFEYDKVLYEMEPRVQQFDIEVEQHAMLHKATEFNRKFYEEEIPHVMPPEPSTVYSDNQEIQAIVAKLDDQTSIPEAPDSLKNAFAVTLFCMEAAFDSRSGDFLRYAFDQYPDRDYLILLQPHTIVEQQLLMNFTQPTKKTKNTFQHVLYIMHRDSLFAQDITIRRLSADDLVQCNSLVAALDEAKAFSEKMSDAASNPSSNNLGYVAQVEGEIVGSFVLSRDVNLDYYTSHFHVQDQILISEQDRKSHTRLIHSCINPIFERSTRFMLKELLRLSDKNCMYFEVNTNTIIPTIFHQFVHIRSRRFPHFLDRKWDHERFVAEDTLRKQEEDQRNQVDGCERDPLDETESPFALCFTTRRHLSEPKIVKNSRIVVVGASDTSISFIEALLSINFLCFTNIVLIAPGGLPHHHFKDQKDNLKAYSTSYTFEELKKLMLESRVRVIDARMVDIDKADKIIVLNDNSVIPYDTLVLGMGIQDNTLNKLGYKSRGIETLENLKRADQILSIDDPQLYHHLRPGGSLVNMLTDKRKIKNCVVYGRTLDTFCCIQGLIQRGVRPEQIYLAIPKTESHLEEGDAKPEDLEHIYPPAFEDEQIEAKIMKQLEKAGVQVLKNHQLFDIGVDNEEGLEYVAFVDLDAPPPDEEDEEMSAIEDENDENASNMDSAAGGTGADGSDLEEDEEGQPIQRKVKRKRKKNERELECRVLITSGHRDVDQDVFLAIHNNGLVYNGRLIVDKSFQATDLSIFAAGSLCEFSGRYKAQAQGRSLRMDRFNGREMGSRLARSVFDSYDGNINQEEEEVPQFYLPQGQGGMLPGNILYYHIRTTNPLIYKQGSVEEKNRPSLTCDNLDDETGKGHFIKFTFNSIGLIDSVTYMGSEQVVLQSLWSFVGLHENYLNQLTSRYEQGIIPNVVEFLSENWAIALYHEWFGDFCLRMRFSLRSEQMADIQAVLEKAFEATKKGEKGISREDMKALEKQVDPATIRMIQEDTLEFVKTNMNHLPMYYIPQKEFN